MSGQTHARPNYAGVFLSLFALTILEIFASQLPWTKALVVAALVGLAVIKAALVAMFYMHLKFEKVLLVVVALVPLIFSVILVSMVGFDIRLAFS